MNEAKVIQEISSEINSTLDLNDILHKILKSMDEVLGFKHSMILLMNHLGDTLTLVASRGYDEDGVGAEVSVGKGIIGTVAKRKRIVRMGNIRSQMKYMTSVRNVMDSQNGQPAKEIVKLPGLENVNSQIGIPLLVKEKLVGVFSVEDTRASAFDSLDEMLLLILANQAGSIIDNARLYKAEIDRVEELNKAYQQLTELNDQLEQKVQIRTKELSVALEDTSKEKQRSIELLERMVPPSVIPLMLEEKLIARKYHATILFTDLQGFTDYSTNMEPDEIFSQLNHFFSFAGEQIETYQGYINKTIGDSVMALFGVPTPTSTHELDAVLAALKMQSEIDQHLRLKMRIGINTGTISAGMLGPENKSIYDVLGDPVNVASRMENVCRSGAVTISQQTYERIKPYFLFEPVKEHDIKGIGLTKSYEVKGIKGILEDERRVRDGSIFVKNYSFAVDEVEKIKTKYLEVVDFTSIQARDSALLHHEAVASFSLALLRHLQSKENDPKEAYSSDFKQQLAEIKEIDLVLFALLHDLGKHKMEPNRLNVPIFEKEELFSLIKELRENTKEVFQQLNLEHLIPKIDPFYEFETTKGSSLDIDAFSLIIATADIYDALTAPKAYKGKPWSIKGTLEELQRMPYTLDRNSLIIKNFVELMHHETEEVHIAHKTKKLFK